MNLSPASDVQVPVFPFAYDWRQPLETTEARVKQFVDEVVARTSLTPHYARDGYDQRRTVALVGHSMGGLVIAGYIEHYKQQSQVSKIATLATPYGGSFEAVIKITMGTADLGTKAPSSRERDAARMTPALYYLIPEVPDDLKVDPALPATPFDPAVWQPSVLGTLQEYVRLHSVNPANPAARAAALFQWFLSAARAHRGRVAQLDLAAVGLRPEDWLCVVGVGTTTRVGGSRSSAIPTARRIFVSMPTIATISGAMPTRRSASIPAPAPSRSRGRCRRFCRATMADHSAFHRRAGPAREHLGSPRSRRRGCQLAPRRNAADADIGDSQNEGPAICLSRCQTGSAMALGQTAPSIQRNTGS